MFPPRPTTRNNPSRPNTPPARPNPSSGRSSPAPAPATPNRSRGPKNSPLNELLRKYPSYTAQQLLANYQKRMRRRVQNMGHAEERIGLQIERLRKRPNLASHVAQAQRNLANAKRLSEAVRRQANNALRGVWSEGPITYHGPVHHRTGWTKGAWADTTRRTLASRQAARNRLLGNETLNAGQAQWVSLSYTGVLGAWPTSTEGLLPSAPYVSTRNEPMAGLGPNGLQVRGWPARGWLGGWLHVREVVGRGSCGQAGLQMAGACKLRVSPCSREGSMGCTLLAAAAAQQTGTQAWGW